jgi:hypothetical protein
MLADFKEQMPFPFISIAALGHDGSNATQLSLVAVRKAGVD